VGTVRVQVRRVYEGADPEDGRRILVDRLWPRGIAKRHFVYDRWAKEVAPSPELRKWYGHDPVRFDEFRRRYKAELEAEPGLSLVRELRRTAGDQPITLLTATKDVDRSGAVVLAEVLGSLDQDHLGAHNPSAPKS
jgi:uncharacterized protein YeaO (DUF488 family)